MSSNGFVFSDTNHVNKNIVFLNISKLILPDFSFGLNHRISKKVHLDFSLAYKLPIKGYGVFLVSPISECGVIDQDIFHWITAEVGFQFFYYKNFYVGNYPFYRCKFYKRQDIYHGCISSVSNQSKIDNILGDKILFGYQSDANPSIDIYIGMGGRSYFYHKNQYSYTESSYPVALPYSLPHSSNHGGAAYTFHLGMRIGLNWKQKEE